MTLNYPCLVFSLFGLKSIYIHASLRSVFFMAEHPFIAKWKSESLPFSFPLSATIAALHQHVQTLMGLETCKLVGLVKGILPPMETLLSALPRLKSPHPLMVIGTQDRAALNLIEAESTKYEVQRVQEELDEQDRQRKVGPT